MIWLSNFLREYNAIQSNVRNYVIKNVIQMLLLDQFTKSNICQVSKSLLTTFTKPSQTIHQRFYQTTPEITNPCFGGSELSLQN